MGELKWNFMSNKLAQDCVIVKSVWNPYEKKPMNDGWTRPKTTSWNMGQGDMDSGPWSICQPALKRGVWYRAAVLNLWSADHWWSAAMGLVVREQSLIFFFIRIKFGKWNKKIDGIYLYLHIFLIILYDKHIIFQFYFYFIWQKQQDTNESKIYSRYVCMYLRFNIASLQKYFSATHLNQIRRD